MWEALASPRNRALTAVYFAVFCVCVALAAAVGISDHPPGIALLFAASIAFILAAVHPWRRARRFLRLLLAAVLGFPVCVALHNVAEVVASRSGTPTALRIPLEGIAGATFFLALLVCPPAFLVGAVGSIATWLRGRRRSGDGSGSDPS